MGTKLNPDAMTAKFPGTTKAYWAQLRFRGDGPRFYKTSPKVIFYDEGEVDAWFAQTAQTKTGDKVSA